MSKEKKLQNILGLGKFSARKSYYPQLKQKIEEIEKERNKAQKYLDIARVLIVALNIDGIVTLINKKGSEILHLKKEEVIGKNWFDSFIPKINRDELKQNFNQLLSQKIEPDKYYENGIITSTGAERILLWSDSLLKDNNNNVIGVIRSGEDITDLRKAQEKIQHLNSLLKAIRDINQSIAKEDNLQNLIHYSCTSLMKTGFYSGCGISLLDEKTNTILPLCQMGKGEYSKGWSVSTNGTGVAPECIKLTITSGSIQCIDTKDCGSCDFSQRTEDRIRILIPMKRNKKVLGVFYVELEGGTEFTKEDRDLLKEVTEDLSFAWEKSCIDKALKKSEHEKSLILDNASEIIAFHDCDNNIIWANQAYLKATGLTLEHIKGKKCYTAWDLSKICIKCPVIRAIQDEETHWEELTPNNQPHWSEHHDSWEVNGAPVRDDNGNVIGAIEIAHNITERKQAEEDLRNTLEKLKTIESIVNRGPVVLFLWKIIPGVWKVDLVSDNVERLLGYKADDFLSGKISWPGITHPDDVPRLESEIQYYLDNDITEWTQEYRLYNESGEIRWIRDWNEVISDSSGNITHIQALVIDVTEQKKSKDELIASENKYKFLTEKINDIVWTADLHFNTTYVSPSIQKNLGFTVEERMKQTVEEQITPETLSMCSKLLKKELQDDPQKDPDRFIKLELDYYHKDSSIRSLETSLSFIRDEGGKPMGIFGISRDITERKKAQTALRKSEEKFRKLIENSNDIFVVLNEKGEELYVSDSVERITGKTAEEYIGTLGFDHIHPDDKEEISQQFHKILENPGMIVHAEYRHQHKNGTWIDLEALGINYLDDPAIQGIVLNIRDVTKRRREELLKQTIFKISHTVNTVENIAELFPKIQQILHNIIDTKNFYVALYDDEREIITLPYMSDEKDKFEQFSPDKSLSSYVINTSKPLLAKKEKILELQEKGLVDHVGTCSEIWLGVPLKLEMR